MFIIKSGKGKVTTFFASLFTGVENEEKMVLLSTTSPQRYTTATLGRKKFSTSPPGLL